MNERSSRKRRGDKWYAVGTSQVNVQQGGALSVHSRLDAVANFVEDEAHVGNLFVNRQQGDVSPGVQPFGGIGLSGSGPQAGGPNFLRQFAQEATRTDNITATGGNVRLLAHDLSELD